MHAPRRFVCLAVAALAMGLAACGSPPAPSAVSKSAIVDVRTKSFPAFDFDRGKDNGATNRQVFIGIHPQCVDGSRAIDCGQLYRFAMQYQYRKDELKSVRCGPANTRAYWLLGSGDVHAVLTGDSDSMTVTCDATDPSTVVTEAFLPIADVTNASPTSEERPAAFQTTMRVTASESEIAYDWRGRSGAHCTGHVIAGQPTPQATCHWT